MSQRIFDYNHHANGHEILFRALRQEMKAAVQSANSALFNFYDTRITESLHNASILRYDFSNFNFGCMTKPPCDWGKHEDNEHEVPSESLEKDIVMLPYSESTIDFFITDLQLTSLITEERLSEIRASSKMRYNYVVNEIPNISSNQEFNYFRKQGGFTRADQNKEFYFTIVERSNNEIQHLFQFQFTLK